MKDTSQKKKEKLTYAVRNNLYLLKLAYRANRSRVLWEFVNTACNYFVWAFASVVLLEYIMDSIELKREFRMILPMIILSVAIFWIINIVNLYCEKIAFPAGNQKLYENLHIKMFEKALDVELECYENPEFYNRYTKAAAQIKGKAFSIIKMVPEFFISGITMIFYIYKTISIDRFAIFFALVPVFSTYVLGKKINKIEYELYQKNVVPERTKDYVVRTIYLRDYAKEMRLSNVFFVMMRYFNDAMKEMIDNVHKYGMKAEIFAGIQGICSQIIIWVGTILYAFVRLFYFKSISVGEFVVLVNVVYSLSLMIREYSQKLTKIQSNSLYIDNIREFLEYEPKISESQQGLQPDTEQFHLSLRDVSFTYFGQDSPVLQHINIDIRDKEKIALVGHNGAGKSTLVKLLMRLYDVSDGEIRLNDRKIQEYQVKAYRDLFATVFQDFQLFSMSVEKNVLMDQVTPEGRNRVIQALKDSGVYDKIMTLPHGLDTTLTREFDKEGAVLSGGEGQKVAIARVFARDSRIVILDEPSSALDPIAEYQMYETMLKACENKAVVFISHRLSSAVLADRIYMLENGSIVEEGTHEELISRNGKYAQMFAMQAKNYT